MTSFCQILPQNLFSKPLQSLKLAMRRKSALLTRYLGGREIIRPKSNRACPRNRSNNRDYHRHGEYHRIGLAKESFPIYRKSTSSGESISRGNPSHDNGVHPWRTSDTSFSSRGLGVVLGNAKVWWRLRSHLENNRTRLGIPRGMA